VPQAEEYSAYAEIREFLTRILAAARYTRVYEFASTAVPESEERKEQQQHSSPNSPRMRQAMTHAPGSAGVYTRIDP
jgi:hypothetical protein